MLRINLIVAALIAFMMPAAQAQDQQGRVMPLEQLKNVLNMTADNWVAFRNFNGKTLIYYSHLVSWRCGLKEVRYGVNSREPDQSWPLPECNKMMPNTVPYDAKIYSTHKLNSVTTLSVQVVYDDDTASPVYFYEPCEGAGDATCAYRN
jgi:hypothetical protein